MEIDWAGQRAMRAVAPATDGTLHLDWPGLDTSTVLADFENLVDGSDPFSAEGVLARGTAQLRALYRKHGEHGGLGVLVDAIAELPPDVTAHEVVPKLRRAMQG